MRLPDPDVTPERLAAAGSGAAPEVLGEAAWGRFLAVNRYMDAIQARVAPPPCLYLVLLRVHPDHQGRGLGGLLLRHFLAAADDAGLPACLGTSEPNNLGFYRRHGCEVVADEVEPGSGVRFWVLSRSVAAPALN